MSTNKTRLFILSELFYPNKTSTAHIMTQLADYLSNYYNTTVICSNILYDSNISVDKDYKENLKKYRTIRNANPKGDKNSFFGRIYNSAFTSISFANSIIKQVKNNDTVLAVTNPFLLILVLSIIKIFKKFKLIVLVHDVFPENSVPANLIKKNSLIYRILEKTYNWSYKKADKLVVLGRDMQELVRTKVGNNKEVIVIENWYDEDVFLESKFDRNEYLKENLSNKFVLGFAGNLGRVQNIQNFLNIYKEQNNNNLHFIIIGDGAESKNIKDYIEKNKIKNVSFLGPKPRQEQSKFLNACDIGLITLSSGMYGLGVPSKTYNLLALGKPILFIGDKKSEIDLLINENKVGWSFDWNDSDSIIQFLENINNINYDMILNAKKIATENYSSEIIFEKFKKVLE